MNEMNGEGGGNLKDLREDNFEITAGGTVLETLQYFTFEQWKYDNEAKYNKLVIEMTQGLLDFFAPMKDDESLKVHKCKSDTASWMTLCGREFLAIVDENEDIVATYLICLN